MAVMDDICDELALKALALQDQTGDEGLVRKIADALATSSPTMEETFLTAVRIRTAERRARRLIATLEGEAPPEPAPRPDAAAPAPEAPAAAQPAEPAPRQITAEPDPEPEEPTVVILPPSPDSH